MGEIIDFNDGAKIAERFGLAPFFINAFGDKRDSFGSQAVVEWNMVLPLLKRLAIMVDLIEGMNEQ